MSEQVSSAATQLGFLSGGPDSLGTFMRGLDWSQSPLGAPDSWSPSLRTTVGMMLAAQAQIVLFWGPHFVALYNDAYRPTIGDKHPRALGRPASENWAELWGDLEPLLVNVRDTRETFAAADRPFYIERHGFGETVYFDISYSAVPEGDGSVGGVLCIVSETTGRVLASRRQASLLQLEDALRGSEDAEGPKTIASDLLCRELGVESASYADVQPNGAMQEERDGGMFDIPVSRSGGQVGAFRMRYPPTRHWTDEETHFARSVVARSWSVSERVRTETLLRQAEARQRQDAERVQMALAAGAIIGTWLWDLRSDRFTVDEKFAVNFGLDPSLGRDGLSLAQIIATVHPDDRPGLERAIAEAKDRGGAYAHQYRVRRSDGRYYWIEANGRVDKASDGTPVSFPGVLIDIEGRRLTEQQLAASEAKYKSLFDSIDEGFCVIEFIDGPHGPLSDYTHVETNPAYTANSGLSNTVGRTVREILPKEADIWIEIYRHVLLTGQPIQFEHELAATDRYLELSAFRVGPAERRQVAVLFKDITTRKRAEEALQGVNRELSERIAQVVGQREAALARIHEMQKLETIGQLTGGVAHDFNNLLTPIVGALDMVSRLHENDDRIRKLTSAGLQAAERARVLVQRLLAFARRQHLEARPINVRQLVNGMEDLLARSLGPQVVLRIECEVNLPLAMIDPNQFELALLNLAVNARDAMPDGGALTVSVTQEHVPAHAKLDEGNYVRVRVSDTGAGMDAETIKRAVEPFFTTKAKGHGTGLGLSMVHGLAAQSGGDFALASTPGQGTTATLWLPATAVRLADGSTPATGQRVLRRAQGTPVLLVDDEELVRSGTADMLADAGYVVHQASSGRQALSMLREGLQVDALVTDYAMPGMTGTQLARESVQLRPGLPVLMITGFASLNDHAVIDLPRLSKPFRQMDLADALADLLEGGTHRPR
ncbi:ATP-binding protein [Dyella sp. C11]|uniref:ATP-binding protein n=1 Tax=Dyella sp. C11 TaxID=2126991 RepID=UPI000D64D85F|nr:ATP-binding protein [Dyella sp. C11]